MGRTVQKNGSCKKAAVTTGRKQLNSHVSEDNVLSRGTISRSDDYSSEDSCSKRKYDTISDEDRLKLILLIKEFGMSCHKASKVLKIAYNNAKVIYRIFKNE